MPVISPYRVVLSAEEQSVLMARARSVRGPYRDRLRAQIVLAAAAGSTNVAIAGRVGAHVDTVRKWRRRFAICRLAGLKDAPRSGRPPVFTAADRAEAVAQMLALNGPARAWEPKRLRLRLFTAAGRLVRGGPPPATTARRDLALGQPHHRRD